VYGLLPERRKTMLGHLVFNRYAIREDRHETIEPPTQPGLMRRVLSALFRRR
jgi:hypothetical protein